MKGPLHAFARRLWASTGLRGPLGLVRLLLLPVEALYASVVRVRNRRWDRTEGARVPGVRVVSVGNLAVGGTGKTPTAAWVARLLSDAGADVALVARGYGRDELLLHHRWNPTVPVVADPDRVDAVRRARAGGAGVVVLDDGFQHRRLARDLDLVLLAAEDVWPGRMLPAGPYREPPTALRRAQAVLVTRRTASSADAKALAERLRADFPHLTVGVVSLMPGGWQDLHGIPAAAPVGPALAAAAIARPDAFGAQLRLTLGVEVELVAFPDHHAYTEADVRILRARAGRRTVVVTEKDAVKLLAFESILAPARVLVQALRWEEGEEVVTKRITSVVG